MSGPDLAPELAAMVADRLGLVPRAPRASPLRKGPLPVLPNMPAPLVGAAIEGDLWQSLIGTITVGETRFLRDRRWFDALTWHALLPLIRRRRAEGRRKLTLWSAGCSTGEEPYTLALLLREALPDFTQWTITIAATDIRTDAIAFAREGIYARQQLRELDDSTIARYFEDAGDGRVRVGAALAGAVDFGFTNLADPASYPPVAATSTADLILCRNVLMYMTEPAQRAVCRRLAVALGEDGVLVTSPAESSASLFAPLEAVNLPDAIFFKKPASRAEAPPRAVRKRDAPAAALRPPRSEAMPPAEADSFADIRALADSGRLDAARAACAARTARQGDSAEINLILAQIALERNDLAGALDASRRAVYLAPRSAAAHFLMASVWRRMEKPDRARRAMRAAAELARADDADPATIAAGISAHFIRMAARAFLIDRGAADG